VPIYEYLCESCGKLTEVMQKVGDRPPARCGECGGKKLAKLVSHAAFQLKGGGWYADLYGPPGKKAAAPAGDKPAAPAGDKPAAPAGDKPAATPEAPAAPPAEKKAEAAKAPPEKGAGKTGGGKKDGS
jgi:putative FmdB family regulatory protein